MASRRSFKTDESFLQKIAMGAVGTQRVFQNLRDQGHTPIELERGSMSFKIWKTIKIKRIRVPDILCVKCGVRVESRAKKSIEISMSHSASDLERSWDYGLENNDYVAFVQCSFKGPSPIAWEAEQLVQFVQVHDMRTAYSGGFVRLSQPKGAEEGFENRVIWPACTASAPGRIEEISKNTLRFKQHSGKTSYPRLLRNISGREVQLSPLVSVGDEVSDGQVLAAVVPVTISITCSRSISAEQYITMLSSSSHSDRYTAAKALFHFPSIDSREALAVAVDDEKNHIYIALKPQRD